MEDIASAAKFFCVNRRASEETGNKGCDDDGQHHGHDQGVLSGHFNDDEDRCHGGACGTGKGGSHSDDAEDRAL